MIYTIGMIIGIVLIVTVLAAVICAFGLGCWALLAWSETRLGLSDSSRSDFVGVSDYSETRDARIDRPVVPEKEEMSDDEKGAVDVTLGVSGYTEVR